MHVETVSRRAHRRTRPKEYTPPIVPAEVFVRTSQKKHNVTRGMPLYLQALELRAKYNWGWRRIADAIGVPRDIVCNVLESRNWRQVSARVPHDTWEILERAASARGVTVTAFARSILEVACEDDMFDSILDDGVKTPKAG